MDLISDDELLDKDTSDDIAIVRNITQEDSPWTFSCHLVKDLGLFSK